MYTLRPLCFTHGFSDARPVAILAPKLLSCDLVRGVTGRVAQVAGSRTLFFCTLRLVRILQAFRRRAVSAFAPNLLLRRELVRSVTRWVVISYKVSVTDASAGRIPSIVHRCQRPRPNSKTVGGGLRQQRSIGRWKRCIVWIVSTLAIQPSLVTPAHTGAALAPSVAFSGIVTGVGFYMDGYRCTTLRVARAVAETNASARTA